MEIIQNKTRINNLALVYEMRKFFDDDSGERRDADFNRKIISGIEICTLTMAGLSLLFMLRALFLKRMGTIGVEKNVGIACICVIIVLMLHVYCLKQNKELDVIFDRYGSDEMLIYWLYADLPVTKITVTTNRKNIRIFRESSIISLPVKGFRIEGAGKEVKTVDLDNKILKTI